MAQIIKITSEQRAEIEKARKENRDKTVERRLNALLLRAEGKTLAQIAEATGYHYAHVSSIISKYQRNGLEKIIKPKYGGNHRNISYEEEESVLAPFKAQAAKGQLVEVREIAEAYQRAVGHKIGEKYIYQVLARHGWRKVMPRSKHPKSADPEVVEASKKLTNE